MTSPNSPDTDTPDALLIKRALDGEDRAYTLIMRRYKDALFRYALRYLGDEDEAEDVVQNAFISAFYNLHRYQPRYQFSTWLYRITLNKCHDMARMKKARRFMRRLVPEKHDTLPDAHSEAPPESRIQARDDLKVLQAGISDLPPKLRAAFILFCLEDRSQIEVGEILGITPKAVELRVYRARQKLKAMLV